MDNLIDYIKVFNAISESDCDFILNNIDDDFEDSIISGNRNGKDTKLRTSSVIYISLLEKYKKIDDIIFQSVLKSAEKYKQFFPFFKFGSDTGYELLRYRTGEYCKEHVDSSSEIYRNVGCSFLLNDDYEGGEFLFLRKQKYKLKKGDCIMFPSNFMYPHEILPVEIGTRYSVVTWINF